MSHSLQDTRTHVVGELYDTEKSYVESLQILVEKYMKPLKGIESNKILIESNLVDEIFYSIPEILQHHENFLSALQDKLSADWDTSQAIGNVFIATFTNQEIIDTYTAFVNNWKNARHAIKVAIQAKPAFERFLEAMSREHRNKLTLDALLIMPVQRIPRYELLIKELIKHTPEDHPDYGPLIEAQQRIHELALKIDQAEKEMIHQEQLRDLEVLIEGNVELQHPQRDFIRYDLVTITGSSSLAVAKKERVLFLFCDLLIMTSVKKKVSRRSNLQTAFANSSNDLSLLEGNKFKLLLRVPLDQVDIRIDNEKLQFQCPPEEKQHKLTAYQKRVIDESRREIEANIHILHQIEFLTSKLSLVEALKINEAVNDFTAQLRDKLYELKLTEAQTINLVNSQTPTHHSAQSIQDSGGPQSPVSVALSEHQKQTLQATNSAEAQQHSIEPVVGTNQLSMKLQSTSTNASPTTNVSTNIALSSTSSNPLESDTSLEFLIVNASKDQINANPSNTFLANDPLTGDHVWVSASDSPTSKPQDQQQQLSSESLVVTFASIERRQAFIQAFGEAKQRRYQLYQQRQQNQKIFSSSITLKLSHSETPLKRSDTGDSRRTKLHHQDNIELCPTESATSSPSRNLREAQRQRDPYAVRISSAPSGKQPPGASAIIHQMSAPQSFASATSLLDSTLSYKPGSHLAASDCPIYGSMGVQDGNQLLDKEQPNSHQHHHHHHQLIHQPASQPASLGTICCYEQHDDAKDRASAEFAGERLDQFEEFLGAREGNQPDEQIGISGGDCCRGQYEHLMCNDSTIPIIGAEAHRSSLRSTGSGHLPACNLNPAILSKFNPKFASLLPINFLNTHHSALQLTCANPRRGRQESSPIIQSLKRDIPEGKATVDNKGLIWLCMSNGHVSHVALVSLTKLSQAIAKGDLLRPMGCPQIMADHSYNIAPKALSSGDICKSQINCVAQVYWYKKVGSSPGKTAVSGRETNLERNSEMMLGNGLPPSTREAKPEEAIKSATSPIDIRPNSERDLSAKILRQSRLSKSAPSEGHDPESFQPNDTVKDSATESQLPLQSRSTQDRVSRSRSAKSSNYSDRVSAQRSACRRNHHVSQEHLRNRNLGATSTSHQALTHNQSQLHRAHSGNTHQHHHRFHSHSHHHQPHHHHHHHHHHHNHHQHSHHHGHQHHFLAHAQSQHHHHQHLSHHHNQMNAHAHNFYTGRHNTMALGELRRALERQNRIHEYQNFKTSRLAPPTNTPANPASVSPAQEPENSLHVSQSSAFGSSLAKGNCKKARSATPPAGYTGRKSFRSARLLRHQASLKTSKILAKLVSGASKGSSYLRNSHESKQHSDVDDTDTDPDSGNPLRTTSGAKREDSQLNADEISQLGSTIPSVAKYQLNPMVTDVDTHVVVSPLSSVSSLTSTNSSMTVNSACASSPRASCSIPFPPWSSATCCILSDRQPPENPTCTQRRRVSDLEVGIRSRSATVPCRPSCQRSIEKTSYETSYTTDMRESYKVSELVSDSVDELKGSTAMEQKLDRTDNDRPQGEGQESRIEESSLWLGCDDGSLIIIDCLTDVKPSNECDLCEMNQQAQHCGNKHTEIKLNAAICDIRTYKDKSVFIALANGQLAIFSRFEEGDDKADEGDCGWSLTTPKLLDITANELNSTSKLCLVDDDFLWYSYGRNIFVLDIKTLKLETTIMAPSNELSLQFAMQSITIDNMEPMSSLKGIWISFKNSHILQFYDTKSYKLIVEVNLFESINKILSLGNEIIRQHKTACLKATSLLNVNHDQRHYSTLFVGTSAGIILYINISHDQFNAREPNDGSRLDLNPQIASLRHGHSGHVKFLQLIQLSTSQTEANLSSSQAKLNPEGSSRTAERNGAPPTEREEEIFLMSGGSGVDWYGSADELQLISPSNCDDDNSNYLMLWKL